MSRNISAVRETKKSYIVDVDDYCCRERYYTGTRAGEVLRIDKAIYPDIMRPYNDHFPVELDAVLAHYEDEGGQSGEGIKGVHVHRKGYVVR